MPNVGQRIVYRFSSTQTRTARVTKVLDATTVNLVTFSDGVSWPDGGQPITETTHVYTEVPQGTTTGTWAEEVSVDPAVSSVASTAAGAAVTTAVANEAAARTAAINSAVAAESAARATAITAASSAEATARNTAIANAIGGSGSMFCAVPGASTAPTLALNAARQPSTTRPVLVSISGTWSWNLTVIGTIAGTVTLQSDANAAPTTVRPSAPFSRTVGVGVTVADSGTLPWSLTYIVPAGHYYRLTTTGSGTFAISRVDEQVL